MAENKNTYGIVYLLVAAVAVAGFFLLIKKIDGFKGRNDTINSVSNINSSTEDTSLALLLRENGWFWTSTAYKNNTNFNPKDSSLFNLVLKSDNTFTATTDCNNAFGKYFIVGSNITFSDIASTKMYCENAQENEYLENLNNIESYTLSSSGVLTFNLKNNGGEMFFNQKVLEQ